MGVQRNLQGMVVVITGASAGIGQALAEALAARGARLVLSARRLDRLETLNASLGGGHLCVRADVAITSDCELLLARAAGHFGRIDTLVCNAGYGIVRGVADTSADEMQRLFQTNVFGTADCVRAAIPLLRKQEKREGYRGQVMIVSSAAARRGLPFFGAYSATKAAQLSLSEALRVELKPDRIAVTSVHPVGTETDFFTTAEGNTGLKLPPKGRGEVRQTAARVAEQMAAAIRRPRPEVWPMPGSRWMLSLATLAPRMGDKIMGKYRGQIVGSNR